jgi:hypothetical protein
MASSYFFLDDMAPLPVVSHPIEVHSTSAPCPHSLVNQNDGVDD